jgi:hypothetical protein
MWKCEDVEMWLAPASSCGWTKNTPGQTVNIFRKTESEKLKTESKKLKVESFF